MRLMTVCVAACGRRFRVAVAAAAFFLAGAAVAVAQDAAPQPAAAASDDSAVLSFFKSTEVSGFVDMYYSYNFNAPKTSCTTIGEVKIFNCLRNFDVAHNSFSLNLAEIAFEKKPTDMSRGGYRIDLNYGPTASIVAGFDPGGTTIFSNIQQAYISYLAPTGKGLQLDFGKFVTPAGNEVIETKDNWNYSRSLLFALAIPYYHSGVRATYAANDKVSFMGTFVNGWNNVGENNSAKTFGAQVALKPNAAFSITQNFTAGPEQPNNSQDWRRLYDTIATYTLNPKVSLMANYDYGSDTLAGEGVHWQGVAGYAKLQANKWLAISPRFEYYDDPSGFTTGTAQTLKEVTGTLELKPVDSFMWRIEYRSDFSDDAVFKAHDGTFRKTQNSIAFGVLYSFSYKG